MIFYIVVVEQYRPDIVILALLKCRSVFFFQAEDGIRVHCVTGVQTCALPISLPRPRPPPRWPRAGKRSSATSRTTGTSGSRSEERRVGKECRSRRASEH